MILLGDIGNSSQRWAIWESGHIGAIRRLDTRDATARQTLFADLGDQGISRVLVSSVAAKSINGAIAGGLEEVGLPQPEFAVTPADGVGCGVTIGYRRPEQLGCDRYLAMVAARARYPAGVIVVDCGTAVTVDAVDSDGRHLGGALFPGRGLMNEVLQRGTGRVRFEQASGATGIFGLDTAEGAAIGVLHAIAGGIDSLVDSMSSAMTASPALVLTGGDSATVEPLLKARYHSHPDLVLEGLAIHSGLSCDISSSF